MSSAPRAPKMANAGFSMRLTPLHSGKSLALNVSSISEPCENFAPTYQCWLHSGVGAYGSQIGAHMCGERPAAVIPVPLATTSAPCVHSAPAAELFPSCQSQRSRLPGQGSYASTKFFEENSSSAGTTQTTLTSYWFGWGPGSPSLQKQDNSFWKPLRKNLGARTPPNDATR